MGAVAGRIDLEFVAFLPTIHSQLNSIHLESVIVVHWIMLHTEPTEPLTLVVILGRGTS